MQREKIQVGDWKLAEEMRRSASSSEGGEAELGKPLDRPCFAMAVLNQGGPPKVS